MFEILVVQKVGLMYLLTQVRKVLHQVMGYFACDGIFSHLYTILINFIKPKVYRSLKIIMVNVNNSFSGIIFKDKC